MITEDISGPKDTQIAYSGFTYLSIDRLSFILDLFHDGRAEDGWDRERDGEGGQVALPDFAEIGR